MEHPSEPFPETRWTLIQRARNLDPAQTSALNEWCQSYWRPVKDYIRAHGQTDEQAAELTQQFFHRMLQQGVERSLPATLQGAFRPYLKRSVKNFLIDTWRTAGRHRRGGGHLHLDVHVLTLPDPGADPELAFARGWALSVIERAASRLQAEMDQQGKLDFFTAVSPLLDGRNPDLEHASLSEKFGMNSGTFRVALYRIRQRFRNLMEEELRETVTTHEELAEEIRYLLSIWS